MKRDNRSRHVARLSLNDAAEIKTLLAMGFPMSKLAKTYGVSRNSILAIANQKSYAYVEPRKWHWE